MTRVITRFPRGSEWRVWDLHIHSPLSIVQNYGGDQEDVWEQYLTALEQLPNDVKVIGLTDYYFIDGYARVMQEKIDRGRLANIDKVFAVIEFRVDTFGAASASSLSKINLHVLFDIDEHHLSAEIKRVKEEFIGQLHLSKQHPTTPLSIENLVTKSSTGKLKAGFAEFIPSTDDVLKLLDSSTWKDRTVVFLGYNEWHELDMGKQVQPTKRYLYDRADFFLTASAADFTSKKKEVLAKFGDRRLIHSLDIHSFGAFEEYSCRTWIKADPTFAGLRHACVEPENRLFVGDSPPEKITVERNRHLFIDSLRVDSSADNSEWLDHMGEVLFNPALNVIIGNKGTGKSALADMIGLAGNCSRGRYSFLNQTKFLALSAHKKYSASIKFQDNFVNTCPFRGARPNPQTQSKVSYLSQSFVNDLCDNIEGVAELQEEIDRVIFSHVPPEHRLGRNDLVGLIEAKARQYRARHSELSEKIVGTNVEIVQLEEMLSTSHREMLVNQLAELKRRLGEITSNEKPKDTIPVSDEVSNQLRLLSSKHDRILKKLELRQEQIRQELGALELSKQNLAEIISDIESIERESIALVERIRKEPSLSGSEIDSIIRVDISKKPLLIVKKELDSRTKLLVEQKEKSNARRKKIDAFIANRTKLLSVQQKTYQEYLNAMRVWNEKQQGLQGDKNTEGTICYLEEQVAALDRVHLPRLGELYESRRRFAHLVVDNIQEREERLSQVYSFVQAEAERLAENYEIPLNEFVVFNTRIAVDPSFTNSFLEFINQNRTGTFYGRDEGGVAVETLIERTLSSEPPDLAELPDMLMQALRHNIKADPTGSDPKHETSIDKQVSGHKTKLQLYNFLFCLDYLSSRFTLTYDSKPLHRLSPGEKGILLLVFFLLVDKDRSPIVIDQPEENLDNETVYKRLVRFIRDRKAHRQIILVTHNPNLAVACDAEEVVCCSMDKMKGNLIAYVTGSIENPAIKEAVLRILEGTRPAFDNRQAKYDI